MAKDSCRKVCIECKRALTGTRGKMQWCDCGGEMREIRYSRPKSRARRDR